jgi:[ribosomal protein S5]-alanine N-acetyltransferase
MSRGRSPGPRSPVRLEKPSGARLREFLAAAGRSRALHRGWVVPPSTPDAYRAYLRRLRRPTHEGHFVVRRASGELVGVVNVSEIVRGAFQSAYLGYYGFLPHVGRGFMREGLRLVLDRAFGELGLHRVEANIQPENRASRTLVRGLGFRREGFSPRYLQVAGRWRDHERWALLAEEWRAGARPARRGLARSRRGGRRSRPARAG